MAGAAGPTQGSSSQLSEWVMNGQETDPRAPLETAGGSDLVRQEKWVQGPSSNQRSVRTLGV